MKWVIELLTVVAACIRKEDKILIAKRATGDTNILGKWEFPGGKVEPGESDEQAIEREIKEELNLEVKALKLLGNHIHTYPNKIVDLRLYECEWIKGEINLKAHSAIEFVNINEFNISLFAEADIPLVEKIRNNYEK